MDFLSSGYKGIIRPWQGSDDTIAIRWYRVGPDALDFPFPCAFTSAIWDTFAGAETPLVGEVLKTREWRSTNLFGAPPGTEFHGDPQWFLTGIPPEHRNDPPPNCYYPCLMTDPKGDPIFPEQGEECIKPNF